VTVALASIDGSYTAVQGFDGGALSFYPDLDPMFNTLLEMQSGLGYWIRTTELVTLTYPAGIGSTADGMGRRIAARQGERDAMAGYTEGAQSGSGVGTEAEVSPTFAWMDYYGEALRPDGTPLPAGTLILALDPQGIVCGATVMTVEGRYGVLACYGDDPNTPADEGARSGDTVEVRAIVDGQAQIIGTGSWTARGDRQQVSGGAPLPLPPTPPPSAAPAGVVYLPLLFGAVPADEPLAAHTWLPLILNMRRDGGEQ
jgi:hypothetical protein